MTVLKIFDKPAPIQPPPERTTFLKLEEAAGYILLKCVDERGCHENCGNLMKFYADGTYVIVEAGEVAGNDFRPRSY